jgi:hypothetical protein
MDDRLTYKIGEVDGVAMMFILDAAEKLGEEIRRFAESLRDKIGDLLDGIFEKLSEAVRETPNRHTYAPVMKIFPAHAAPVRTVQYRARSRC